jgi:hypothetical protein
MKTPDASFKNEAESGKNARFERLVRDLLAGSDMFPEKQLTADTKVDVMTAIEKNLTASYVGARSDGKFLEGMDCLVAIYDEVHKEQPDEAFIEETVEQLKEYLH